MRRLPRLLLAGAAVCLLASRGEAAQTAAPAASACPHCIACPTGEERTRLVRVRVYNQTRLDQASLDAVVDVAAAIWRSYGVVVEPGVGGDAVTVIVSDGRRQPELVSGRPVLGDTLFSSGHAVPYIRLWLGAAASVAEAAPTRGTPFNMLPRRDREAIVRQVMGVAFAHELGHYLLDTGQHSNRGLLQAALPLRDLSQPERGRLELTPAQQLLMCGSPAR